MWKWGFAILAPVVLTVGVAAAIYAGGIPTPSFGQPGRIIVSSPSVYTRQRLVNDRLTQSAWLQDQLRVTEKPPTEFRAVDEVHLRSDWRSLGARVDVRGPSEAPAQGRPAAAESDQAASAATAPQQTPTRALSATPIEPPKPPTDAPAYKIEQTTAELFRTMNNYREEVRSEMMQTLLDDRHDIQGNTIYRLAVDTTVLTGNRKSDLAIVDVRLQHDPSTLTMLNEDYKLLYSDWARHVQSVVSPSVDLLAKSLLARQIEPRVRWTLPRFLEERICVHLERASGADNAEARCSRDTMAAAQMAGARGTSSPVGRASQALAAYVDEFLKSRAAIARADFDKAVAIGVAAASLERSEFASAFEIAERGCRDAVPQTPVRIVGARGAEVTVPCPTVPDVEGLIAGLSLFATLSSDPKSLDAVAKAEGVAIEAAARTAFQSTREKCVPSSEVTCLPPDLPLGEFRCVAADYIRWTLDGYGDAAARGRGMSSLLDLETTGQNVRDCNLVVSPRSNTGGGGPADTTPGSRLGDAVEKLRDRLNEWNEVYAYSVSPRNLAQRISTVMDTREALDFLSRMQGGYAGVAAAADAEASRKRAEQLQAIASHPIVVPFGHSPAKTTANPPYTTQFGWAIAPRLRGSGDPEHIDGQYPLSAVISVPGWWRSVQLVVQTCWVPRKELHAPKSRNQGTAADPLDLCAGNAGKAVERHADIVRLPGMITEVSRKLGFEVVQEPYLKPEQLQYQTLQVGYQGEILLTGGRLWRSTEVTLGSQKADRITVLPNMEGIIATFSCVRPQGSWVRPSGAPAAPMPLPVRVWTSEGDTPPPRPETVMIEVAAGLPPRGAKPCRPDEAPIVASTRPADRSDGTQRVTHGEGAGSERGTGAGSAGAAASGAGVAPSAATASATGTRSGAGVRSGAGANSGSKPRSGAGSGSAPESGAARIPGAPPSSATATR